MLLVLCSRCGDIAEVVGGCGGGDLGEPAVRLVCYADLHTSLVELYWLFVIIADVVIDVYFLYY
jgi:hypothetical protein